MSKVNCQEGVQIPNSPFPRIENRKFKESRTSLLGNRHDPTLKRAVKTLEMHHLCRESYFSLFFFLSSVWTLSWLIEIELHLRREAGDGMMGWWQDDGIVTWTNASKRSESVEFTLHCSVFGRIDQLFRDFEKHMVRDRFMSWEIYTRPGRRQTARPVSLGRWPTQGRGKEQREHATSRRVKGWKGGLKS